MYNLKNIMAPKQSVTGRVLSQFLATMSFVMLVHINNVTGGGSVLCVEIQ